MQLERFSTRFRQLMHFILFQLEEIKSKEKTIGSLRKDVATLKESQKQLAKGDKNTPLRKVSHRIVWFFMNEW